MKIHRELVIASVVLVALLITTGVTLAVAGAVNLGTDSTATTSGTQDNEASGFHSTAIEGERNTANGSSSVVGQEDGNNTEKDFFFSGEKRIDVVIALDQIGIVVEEGVITEQVREFA